MRVGDDWFVEIETRVREAKTILLLLTPESKGRPWVHFEAGGGWFLEKHVVPLCARGLSIDNLPAPLNRRQAIDISTEGEFNKLVREIARRADLNAPECTETSILELAAPRRIGHAAEPTAPNDGKEVTTVSVDDTPDDDSLPPHVNSAVLFSWRLSDAFPGLRGIEEYLAEAAVDRLDVLLRSPLTATRDDDRVGTITLQPFWWFRGGATNAIDEFERLGSDKVLMFPDELKVRRIVAVRVFDVPERDFVYLESAAEPPIGLYNYEERDFDADLKDNLRSGYSYFLTEEYAVWNDRLITRQEYDDNATVVDGKPVKTPGAQLRARYLTPYNIVIAGNSHVVNQNEHDVATQGILDGILRGENTVDDLIRYVGDLPRPHRFGR